MKNKPVYVIDVYDEPDNPDAGLMAGCIVFMVSAIATLTLLLWLAWIILR